MRRFTDPLLFAILFALTALTWLLFELTNQMPEVEPGLIAPMTVAVVVIIATPALLFSAILGLVRALFNVRPRLFYAWVTGSFALAAGLLALASIITRAQELDFGIVAGIWFTGIISLSGLIALVLALTGAIPTAKPEKEDEKVTAGATPVSTARQGETTDQVDLVEPVAKQEEETITFAQPAQVESKTDGFESAVVLEENAGQQGGFESTSGPGYPSHIVDEDNQKN